MKPIAVITLIAVLVAPIEAQCVGRFCRARQRFVRQRVVVQQRQVVVPQKIVTRKAVVQKVVAQPVVQKVSYVAPVERIYYSVGDTLRYQAQVAKTYRDDHGMSGAEMERLFGLYLKLKDLSAIESQAPSDDPGTGVSPPVPGDSLLVRHCAKCHGTDLATPKGQVFVTPNGMDPNSIYRAVNAVAAGHMPKGAELSDAEKIQVIAELYAAETDE